ncbi:transposase [Defluviimonas sp. 20V17]|uniref:Single-stranded DNA endonuclease n=1 Tax=Allgaiera indica TaxID=765699 RepID=A0AAN4ZYI3_9RHOB|nr:DUF2958 domain-containing protein [Allgaiera indica]KDB04503.1 transposase [Defluviimonas sp. 20V17]GHD99788.1 single-stranded DNA endonuclease [Allgaiera indica]SDW18239.1 Protein of unknown function [Allgaiera indica]
MKLLTQSIRDQLLRNGHLRYTAEEAGEDEPDFLPVVKLFTPDAGCTWLLTELDPEDNDIAFGLCDLGIGFPELGRVRISELEEVKGCLGLPVERDLHFRPKHTIAVYARAAWNAAGITERPDALQAAVETFHVEGAR